MDIQESRIKFQAERLYEQYRDKIDDCVAEYNRRHVRPFSRFDAYALGRMLENYETWVQMMPEEVVRDNLGRVLPIAMDIISASYATSIMSVISSIQPIDDEVGIVFFKRMTAGSTRQGVTAGDQLMGEFGYRAWGAQGSYASNYIRREAFCYLPDAGQGVPALTDASYTKTLQYTPVLRRTVTLEILDQSVAGNPVLRTAIDDGGGNNNSNIGNLYGNGITGTVNYSTGSVTFALTDATGLTGGASGVGDLVKISYETDIEKLDNIPKISWETVSTEIKARTYMLEGDWGVLTEYALQKRFGRAMDEEIASDLVSEINAEVTTSAILELVRGCPTSIDWDATPPAGTSAFEHKLSFYDAIEAASTKIADTAGRGTVNYLIAAGSGLVTISTQPGFKKVATGSSIGPQVYGILNDTITVIRVPGTDVVPPTKIYAGYRGGNWFESAVVYAPYLPLFVTDTATVTSSLRRAKGVAHAAGVRVVAPAFTTCINIT
jgi:hypothetical protein